MALRITFIWSIVLLCGWLLRTFIPARYGVFSMGKDVGHVFALNLIGFWFCIFAAIILTIPPVVRAFMRDFAIGTSSWRASNFIATPIAAPGLPSCM